MWMRERKLTSHEQHVNICVTRSAHTRKQYSVFSAGTRFRILHVGFTWANKCEVRAVDLYATRDIDGKSLSLIRSWVQFYKYFAISFELAERCYSQLSNVNRKSLISALRGQGLQDEDRREIEKVRARINRQRAIQGQRERERERVRQNRQKYGERQRTREEERNRVKRPTSKEEQLEKERQRARENRSQRKRSQQHKMNRKGPE